jgi:hypothetical protein
MKKKKKKKKKADLKPILEELSFLQKAEDSLRELEFSITKLKETQRALKDSFLQEQLKLSLLKISARFQFLSFLSSGPSQFPQFVIIPAISDGKEKEQVDPKKRKIEEMYRSVYEEERKVRMKKAMEEAEILKKETNESTLMALHSSGILFFLLFPSFSFFFLILYHFLFFQSPSFHFRIILGAKRARGQNSP